MSKLPHLPLMIDNAPHDDPSATIITNHSAHLSVPYSTYTSCTPSVAAVAAASSQRAFKTWSLTTPSSRRAILQKTAALVLTHQDELVRLQVEETNCPAQWAMQGVIWAAAHLEEMAARITTVLSGELPVVQTPGMTALAYKAPIGPVLSIPPWNAALFLACRAIDTPLAVGCTVILKASEQSPRTHHFLAGLFWEAGLPKGVLNVVQCGREDAAAVTEVLVSHEAVRKVEFIGSAAVGRAIGALAGKYLKPMLMELGGKSALVVCEDADLEGAARAAVMGGFVHHGQICFSTERVIVRREVEGRFLEVLKAVAAQWDCHSAIGSAGPSRTLKLVKDAVAKGAEVMFGDVQLRSETMMTPVILKGVPKDAEISDEESFGPVLALYIADSDQQAVEMANDTQYGLAAGVWSKDVVRALRIARQIEAGQTHINLPFGTGHDEATIPVGVTKGSGFGKGQNGSWGLEEFLATRTVTFTDGQAQTQPTEAANGHGS
ncbi:uncharacterized protein HMPREF1541_09146 [Cyphellophora europaea CBS 101466]|uniref:Aldehyde dehydrogenase domain-containing protein n=1 Tax=Cyphellophora europaea (strain CBS 101466) TaxID=1220924 RepID=W2S9J5_CYPE1|nr:uncharacterized protein HMPREF1541_09146 [Cyphellophora europaea CBS 101466]ETN45315.1 hypothetical protein HMPREF1541_09146 [Cyphellophora europaea CBS 101466]